MSWLFSRALVAEYSADTCLDGELSVQLNVMPTAHKFSRNDKTMEPSDHSRFGLTSAVLTDDRGVELLTSYLAAFPVRTSAQQEKALASLVPSPACGATWLASFAKWTPESSTWRTAQYSLLADSGSFSETWPRWGSMLNGVSYLRPTWVPSICESASGFWQTPVADDAVDRAAGKWNSRGEPKLSAEVKLWPTPTVCGNHNQPGASKQAGWGLSSAVKLWPTPTATLGTKGGRITERKGREGGTLIEAVSARMFPTPAARDFRSPNAKPYSERGGGKKGEQLPNFVGGQLNPMWVEWLMGWPIGWTELKPLAMGRFHEWQQQHSPCSQET